MAFPGVVEVFKDVWLPEPATPAGYAALIDAYDLQVPLPRSRSAVSPKHGRNYKADGWTIFEARRLPEPTLYGHLEFALKNEGVDLLVLKRLFAATGQGPVTELVQTHSTGIYARRVWFLFEWLMDAKLDVPDATSGAYVDAIDTDMQWSMKGTASKRHRVRDNMPGTPDFCPLVFRTDYLRAIVARDLGQDAKNIVADVPADVLSRAAAFLLLKDSKSSFEIEGERPGPNRIQRWGRAIAQAGRRPISGQELDRLQGIVLEGNPMLKMGLRTEPGFIGEHDRKTHEPLPDHISARHEDLAAQMRGMVDYDRLVVKNIDPVVAAGVLAFGFVFIHPYADGNGRLHRYLIHHVLAATGFSPEGVVFPVSAVMANDIPAYQRALEAYSGELLPFIDWRPAPDGNVVVLNDTADFYRYFDATPQVEFLYQCVERTVDFDLPYETRYLQAHDAFMSSLRVNLDIPGPQESLLFSFLHSGKGTLSKRARTKEFAALSDDQVELVESLYQEAFAEVFEPSAAAPPRQA